MLSLSASQLAASCVQVFFMRNGSNYGNKSYFPKHEAEAAGADIIAAFIGQFYDDKPCPPDILSTCCLNRPI